MRAFVVGECAVNRSVCLWKFRFLSLLWGSDRLLYYTFFFWKHFNAIKIRVNWLPTFFFVHNILSEINTGARNFLVAWHYRGTFKHPNGSVGIELGFLPEFFVANLSFLKVERNIYHRGIKWNAASYLAYDKVCK